MADVKDSKNYSTSGGHLLISYAVFFGLLIFFFFGLLGILKTIFISFVIIYLTEDIHLKKCRYTWHMTLISIHSFKNITHFSLIENWLMTINCMLRYTLNKLYFICFILFMYVFYISAICEAWCALNWPQ